MADSKISELTALTTPASDDVLAIVDTSAGVTKKITISNLSTSSEVVDDTSPQLGGDLASNGSDILFADNDKAKFGTGNDLEIYHDGSDSFIKDAGTGRLLFLSNEIGFLKSDGNEFMLRSFEDGRVSLLHDSAEKLTTTSTGIDVTGTVTADGLTVGDGGSVDTKIVFDGNAQDFYVALDDSADDLVIGLGSTVGTTPIMSFDESKNVTIHDGTLKVESDNANALVAPLLQLDRISSSPADGDLIGAIRYTGRLDNGSSAEFAGLEAKIIESSTADGEITLNIAKGGNVRSAVKANNTEVIINDASEDIDFRVESNGNANMLHVNGGSNLVGIGADPDLGVGLHIKSADSGASAHASADELVIEGSANSGINILSGNSSEGAIYFGDDGDNNIGSITYTHNNNNLHFDVNASRRMTIDSAGRLAIGNTSAGSFNSQAYNLVVGSGSGANGLTIYSGNDSSGNIFFADGTSGSDPVRGGVNYNHSSNEMYFRVNDTNRLTIYDGGNLQVDGASTPKITVRTADGTSASIKLQRVNENDASTDFELKNDGGVFKIIGDNNSQNEREIAKFETGAIIFNEGSEDIDFRVESNGQANMLFVDGGNDRIGFGTNAPTQHTEIVLNSTGAIPTSEAIGSSNAGVAMGLGIHNESNSATYTGIALETRTSGASRWLIANEWQSTYLGDLVFRARSGASASTERMRIKNNGDIEFGSFSTDGSSTGVSFEIGGSSAPEIYSSAQGTATRVHYQFYNDNGIVGKITTNGSATTFNTSSDYRLKENVSYNFDATTRLKQLKPSRFNFKADADTTVDGFLAHEVSSIVPEAISGEKDATETKTNVVINAKGQVIAEEITEAQWTAGRVEDENGNTRYPTNSTWEASKVVPVYQGIDQSKLVPLLVKTIQELEARITTLENN